MERNRDAVAFESKFRWSSKVVFGSRRKPLSVSIESGRCEKGMDFFAVECYPSCLPDMGQSVLFIAPWLTRSHAATCPRVPKHTETSVHRLVLFDP